MQSLVQWVLDTNVIVTGLLSPHGSPARLVDALLTSELQLVFDDRIAGEYREVLSRPKFQMDAARVCAFFAILPFQRHVTAQAQRGLVASNPCDTMFQEVAATCEHQTLVTGNGRYFPAGTRGNV